MKELGDNSVLFSRNSYGGCTFVLQMIRSRSRNTPQETTYSTIRDRKSASDVFALAKRCKKHHFQLFDDIAAVAAPFEIHAAEVEYKYRRPEDRELR